MRKKEGRAKEDAVASIITGRERRLLELLVFGYEWIGTCACANNLQPDDPLTKWLDDCQNAVEWYEKHGIKIGDEKNGLPRPGRAP